ncbi:MAG: helix-turn-helix domain-containing protein [Muribaculaceae bacterium]
MVGDIHGVGVDALDSLFADSQQKGLYPITEIAYQCGFSSHSSFAESFKRQFGMSASDFMQQNHPRP